MFALEIAGNAPLALQALWFILIAVLWIGYLVLEGFDYGVGMLIPFLAKSEKEKRVMVNTIGPVWDGNEVWLLTAGGATFAAFPAWYATLFSGLYLPLFLVLVGLIIRGVAFEYRSKHPDAKWRNAFDWMASIGSFIVTLVFGVGFANFIIGLPGGDGARQRLAVRRDAVPVLLAAVQLVRPARRGLPGRAVPLPRPAVPGPEDQGRDPRPCRRLGQQGRPGLDRARGDLPDLLEPDPPGSGILGWILLVLAAAGLASAWWFNSKGRDGIAFISTTAAILFVAVGIFAHHVAGPRLLRRRWWRFAAERAATPRPRQMTLTLMTVAACIFVPIVLAYTAWTYTVFRRRLGVENIPDDEPAPALAG